MIKVKTDNDHNSFNIEFKTPGEIQGRVQIHRNKEGGVEVVVESTGEYRVAYNMGDANSYPVYGEDPGVVPERDKKLDL